MTGDVVFLEAGADEAAILALLWARAEARRRGEPVPEQAGDDAIEAVRARLTGAGALAILGFAGDRPVAGCYATRAVSHGRVIPGRAHVSGVAVDPGRWGEGLATALVGHLEDALAHAGYATVQLQVLEVNSRARALYERLGWRLVRVGETHPLGPHALYEKRLTAAGSD